MVPVSKGRSVCLQDLRLKLEKGCLLFVAWDACRVHESFYSDEPVVVESQRAAEYKPLKTDYMYLFSCLSGERSNQMLARRSFRLVPCARRTSLAMGLSVCHVRIHQQCSHAVGWLRYIGEVGGTHLAVVPLGSGFCSAIHPGLPLRPNLQQECPLHRGVRGSASLLHISSSSVCLVARCSFAWSMADRFIHRVHNVNGHRRCCVPLANLTFASLILSALVLHLQGVMEVSR